MMDTSVNIAGTKQINYVQLQLHVHAVHIRNTNIFKLAWRMIMAVERLGEFVKCAGCGITAAQKQGANNWHICDTCFTAYCTKCFKASSFCSAHNPWGKWLTGSGRPGTMTFTLR